jgi:hypothetical protein
METKYQEQGRSWGGGGGMPDARATKSIFQIKNFIFCAH